VKAVDSSALIKYFTREDGWERVRELILEGVITLDMAVKEVANALWRRILQGEMGYEIALKIVKDLAVGRAIPLEGEDKYVDKAFEIAVKSRVTVYDAMFIVLARELNLELVTSDRKQAEVATENGVKTMLV
jgi:predicted nucleic acid-binding protein